MLAYGFGGRPSPAPRGSEIEPEPPPEPPLQSDADFLAELAVLQAEYRAEPHERSRQPTTRHRRSGWFDRRAGDEGVPR